MRRSRSVPRRPVHTVRDLLKHAPLLAPVDAADDGPQVSLVEALDERQKQDLFLNFWSQIEQLHDLGHTGSRHPAEAGQFCIIPNRSIPQQPLQPDGEGAILETCGAGRKSSSGKVAWERVQKAA